THSVSKCFSFFFSSRRRHTRSKRDWSSDVCSSDLADIVFRGVLSPGDDVCALRDVVEVRQALDHGMSQQIVDALEGTSNPELSRSEERRVGKECRSRWSPNRTQKTRECGQVGPARQ